MIGTRASVEFTFPFFQAGSFDLLIGGERTGYADPNGLRGHSGLCYQATAVAQHVADGLTESPLRPLDESIAVLEVIDEVRRRIGALAPA